jgi:hypothetical protein
MELQSACDWQGLRTPILDSNKNINKETNKISKIIKKSNFTT